MIAHLQASVQSNALLQLTMLKPDTRPADYNRVAVHEEKEETTIGKSTVSKWWAYYDDAVENVLRKMRREIEG
jgi:hypothetical protein